MNFEGQPTSRVPDFYAMGEMDFLADTARLLRLTLSPNAGLRAVTAVFLQLHDFADAQCYVQHAQDSGWVANPGRAGTAEGTLAVRFVAAVTTRPSPQCPCRGAAVHSVGARRLLDRTDGAGRERDSAEPRHPPMSS